MTKQELLAAAEADGPTFERMGLLQKLTVLFNNSGNIPFGEPLETSRKRNLDLVRELIDYVKGH